MISLDEGGRGARNAVLVDPPAGLEPLVEAIWVLPSPSGPVSGQWRVVADASPHVLLHRLVGGRARLTVVGARSRFVDVDHRQRAYTVGVRLRAGALPLLTKTPASDLLDRGAHVSQLFGAVGAEVTRRVQEAEEASHAVEILAAFLRRRLEGAGPVDWRVRGLMAQLSATPSRPIRDVARALGVSPRSLRATVREHVGLAPKDVQSVRRLMQSLTAMQRGASGAEAACSVGFSDQAHLSHECVDLLGEPPRRFLNRRMPIPTRQGMGRGLT